MNVGGKAAGDIDLAVQRCKTDMGGPYGHTGKITPASRLGVELLEQRRILPAQRFASRHIDFSLVRIGEDLGPRCRHLCCDRPFAWRIVRKGEKTAESQDR